VYSYDKDVDVLYISFCPGEKATTAVELNDAILLRLNKEGRLAGSVTLMDFKDTTCNKQRPSLKLGGPFCLSAQVG